MKRCIDCKQTYPDDLAVCPDDGQPLVNADGSMRGDPFLGKVIREKYRIERLLGRGGMGSVYEGTHLMLNRQVAIKVMNAQITSDETAAARFIREAKASAKIDHPNALIIHDFGVLEDGGAFIVMEFIAGQSLRRLLNLQISVPLDQAIEWITTICAVVDVAHQRGIIHRDLKPENIMLKEADEGTIIKVVDFGLAKLHSGDGQSARLTKTGEVMGTPQYMAPELYDGETADPRSDIYALGIIFYEMITGASPYSGTIENIIAGHLFKEVKPASEINKTISPAIDEVIKLALKKDPAERIASAMKFAHLLKQAAGENSATARNLPAPTRAAKNGAKNGADTGAITANINTPNDGSAATTLYEQSQIESPSNIAIPTNIIKTSARATSNLNSAVPPEPTGNYSISERTGQLDEQKPTEFINSTESTKVKQNIAATTRPFNFDLRAKVVALTSGLLLAAAGLFTYQYIKTPASTPAPAVTAAPQATLTPDPVMTAPAINRNNNNNHPRPRSNQNVREHRAGARDNFEGENDRNETYQPPAQPQEPRNNGLQIPNVRDIRDPKELERYLRDQQEQLKQLGRGKKGK